MAATIIDVQALCFAYGMRQILRSLSFSLGAGEIVGLLGPNGAGKTTCLRLLSGYMPATSGRIEMSGSAVSPENIYVRRRIGYVPEQAPLQEDLTAREHVQFALEAHDCSLRALPQLLATFELTALQHVAARALSKGYRRRVALAMAFAATPQLLLLDEPGDGLDPNQKRALARTLTNAASSGAVLLSTHQLEDAERFCSRVLLLHQGSICFDGSPAQLRALTPHATLDAAFAALTQAAA